MQRLLIDPESPIALEAAFGDALDALDHKGFLKLVYATCKGRDFPRQLFIRYGRRSALVRPLLLRQLCRQAEEDDSS